MSNHSLLRAAARLVFTLALLALAAVVAPLAHAQSNFPPERLTYQGFLADGNGNALGTNAPKNYDVIFRIYDAETAGVIKWQEQQTVTVDKGYFSVLLGEGTVTVGGPSISAVFNSTNASERHMQMTVKGIGAGNSDVNILPRLRMLSAPYAFLAGHARSLVSSNGTTLISSVGTNVTVAGTLTATSFSGSGANLTPGTNVALRSGGNTFSGQQIFNNAVGIGTATPSGKLEVFNTSSADLHVNSSEGHDWTIRAVGNGNTAAAGSLSLIDGATARLVIGPSGNVGLGALNPGFPLSFANTLGDKIALYDSGGAGNYGFGVQGGLLQIHADVAASDIAFGYGSSAAMTERMRIKGNGNVGIGITNPAYPLSFGSAFGDKIAFRETVPGNPYGIGVQANLLQLITPGSIAFGTGNSSSFSEFMRANLNGVGIGTANPESSGKLHIRQNSVGAYNSPVYAIQIDNAVNTVGGNARGGIRFTDDGFLDATVLAKANNPVAARLNNAGTWFSTSDGRMKKDVAPLNDMLEKALRLRPVNYHFTNQTSDESLNMGFIAQEVQREFPSLVAPGTMLSLNYSGFGVVAIGAIQELNQQIKTENKSLRESLDAKDAELAGVKERLAALEELVRQNLGGAKAAK